MDEEAEERIHNTRKGGLHGGEEGTPVKRGKKKGIKEIRRIGCDLECSKYYENNRKNVKQIERSTMNIKY